MQDRVWSLRTVGDGRAQENLSTDEAIKAIRYAMNGLEPFGERRDGGERPSAQQLEAGLAA